MALLLVHSKNSTCWNIAISPLLIPFQSPQSSVIDLSSPLIVSWYISRYTISRYVTYGRILANIIHCCQRSTTATRWSCIETGIVLTDSCRHTPLVHNNGCLWFPLKILYPDSVGVETKVARFDRRNKDQGLSKKKSFFVLVACVYLYREIYFLPRWSRTPTNQPMSTSQSEQTWRVIHGFVDRRWGTNLN